MSKVWLEVLAVLAGMAVAVILIAFGESLSHLIYAPPGGDYTDRHHLKQLMADVSAIAYVVILLAWFVGTAVGSWTAGRLTARKPLRAAMIVGGVMWTTGIFNLAMIPHPLWVTILGTLVFPLGCGMGGKAALGAGTSVSIDD